MAAEREPVIPLGNPLNERVIALLNVPISATLTPTFTGHACATETAVLAKVTAKFGATASVSGRLIVWLNAPPLAVIAKL